jgi:2'-5' RNA ligase
MKSYQIVAIIPPDKVCESAGALMLDLNMKYKTSKALEYGPHITLKSMGLVENDRCQEISEIIKGIADRTEPFMLEARGFRPYGSNVSMPGIYMSVKGRHLSRIHKNLAKRLGQFSDRDRSEKENDNYSPHMTIVGSDIKAKHLKEIGKLTAPYYMFSVDKIFLITRNEGLPHEASYEPFKLNESNKTELCFGRSKLTFSARRCFDFKAFGSIF